jgi:hypothetical protein
MINIFISALELIRHQPAAFVDLVNCQMNCFNQTQMKTQKMPQNIANVDAACVAMPTQLENKCCTQTRQPCITLALSSHS